MNLPTATTGIAGRRWLKHPAISAPSARLPELDGLRALAVLTVIGAHCQAELLLYGWPAVDLFFVLSGYLITSIILEHADSPRFLLPFYFRRGLRIWPIYYLTVSALWLACPYLPRAWNVAGLPWVLTYTQNVSRYWSAGTVEFTAYFRHTWSLAIEEQFYLLWPALILLVGRKRLRPLCLGVIILALVARAGGLHWWTLAARCDGLALGGLLAALGVRPSAPERSRSLTPVLFAVGGLATLSTIALLVRLSLRGIPPYPAPSLFLFSINLVWFALVGLAVLHSGHPALRCLRSRGLCYLGQISYGLYLYHFVILAVAGDLARVAGLHGRPLWRDLLLVAVCVGVAVLSWRFVERPLLRLKDRIPYPRRQTQDLDCVPAGRPRSSLAPTIPERTTVPHGSRDPSA